MPENKDENNLNNNEVTNITPQEDNQADNSSQSEIPFKMEAEVIGEIPVEKQKGLFGTIFFFVLLIAFALGLPYISDYVKTLMGTNQEEQIIEEPQEEKPAAEGEVKEAEDVLYYEIDPNTTFSVEDLSLSNFSKEFSDDYYLLFMVGNKKLTSYKFDENYYLELLTQDKTLIERVKIASLTTLDGNGNMQLKLPISENAYNNATLMTVSKKTSNDYPDITLQGKSDEYATLVCKNNTREITYYFNEDSLEKISDVYEYLNSDENTFRDKLKEETTQAASLNNVDGITSSIVDTTSSFTVNTQIDLTKADLSKVKSLYYYKKGTLPKVVKFEMEAMRYTCQ